MLDAATIRWYGTHRTQKPHDALLVHMKISLKRLPNDEDEEQTKKAPQALMKSTHSHRLLMYTVHQRCQLTLSQTLLGTLCNGVIYIVDGGPRPPPRLVVVRIWAVILPDVAICTLIKHIIRIERLCVSRSTQNRN